MSLYRLRYTEVATNRYDRPSSIRYPWRHGVDLETAEHMRQAMPDPDLFEIVEDGE